MSNDEPSNSNVRLEEDFAGLTDGLLEQWKEEDEMIREEEAFWRQMSFTRLKAGSDNDDAIGPVSSPAQLQPSTPTPVPDVRNPEKEKQPSDKLRINARQHLEQAKALAQESQFAWQLGDRAEAKLLSVQSQSCRTEAARLNKLASEQILRDCNLHRPLDELDLHGQYGSEAVEIAENAISLAQNSGHDQLRIIAGRGLHSEDSQSKLKPFLESLLTKLHLEAKYDPTNDGVLIVYLHAAKV